MLLEHAPSTDAAAWQEFHRAMRPTGILVTEVTQRDETRFLGSRLRRAVRGVKDVAAPAGPKISECRLAVVHEGGVGQRAVRMVKQPFCAGSVMDEGLSRRIALHHVPFEFERDMGHQAERSLQQLRRQQKRVLVAVDQVIELATM